MARPYVLIPAAGAGTRSGLSYPKTLFPLRGKPILIHLLESLGDLAEYPTIIVSPAGHQLVKEALAAHGRQAHLVVQPSPRGMGDAVLRFEESPAFEGANSVLLAWGDIPYLSSTMLSSLTESYDRLEADFLLPTRLVDAAYTIVRRSADGRVSEVIETRESATGELAPGERDIGVFLFRKEPVFRLLKQELARRISGRTGEHGFLYVISHLVAQGYRVEALPVAEESDLVSFNSPEDILTHL